MATLAKLRKTKVGDVSVAFVNAKVSDDIPGEILRHIDRRSSPRPKVIIVGAPKEMEALCKTDSFIPPDLLKTLHTFKRTL